MRPTAKKEHQGKGIKAMTPLQPLYREFASFLPNLCSYGCRISKRWICDLGISMPSGFVSYGVWVMNNYTNDLWNLHDFCKGMLHMYLYWASKEIYHWHSPKSKASKWLLIRHRLAIVHLLKKTVCLSQKGINCSEIARGNFSKITETARPPGTELDTDKNQCGSYITYHWNWMNSYWMFWIGGRSWRVSVSNFCAF